MIKPLLIPLHKQDILLGVPMAFPLFDAQYNLLVSEGESVNTEQQLATLMDIGAFRAAHWQTNQQYLNYAVQSGQAQAVPDFASLKLHPGTSLHLHTDAGQHEGFVAVKLLGWQEFEDLIVTATDRNGAAYSPPIGSVLECKLLAGKGVVTFQTTVMATSLLPYPYLHLSYPASIQIHQLRKSLRVTVTLSARASSDDAVNREVLVTNLSACGCMLESPKFFAQTGDEMQLMFSLPAAGQEHTLAIRALVRNQHTHHVPTPAVMYGLEFIGTSASERLVLEHYIFQSMLVEH